MSDTLAIPALPLAMPGWRRLALRFAVIAAAVLLAHFTLGTLGWMQDGPIPPNGVALLAVLVVYAAMLALPFVPGVEIGLALMVLHGAKAAPLVYLATVLGLFAAYLAGRALPLHRIGDTLMALRCTRAGQALHRFVASPGPAATPAPGALWPGEAESRFWPLRYAVLGLLFNLPGNALLGGGGGLAVIAGASGRFKPLHMLMTIALAVLPVPLAVWLLGPLILPH